jgi:Rrf2 family protein
MNIDFAIGLHIVGFLASREGEQASSAIMAKSFGTSPVVLRRVLSRLNQSGLVETKRGANGGSVLARPATSINLREVYESVCVVPELFARHPQGEGAISNAVGGYINDFYSEAEKVMFSHLELTSVADMDATVRPRIIAMLNCN